MLQLAGISKQLYFHDVQLNLLLKLPFEHLNHLSAFSYYSKSLPPFPCHTDEEAADLLHLWNTEERQFNREPKCDVMHVTCSMTTMCFTY